MMFLVFVERQISRGWLWALFLLTAFQTIMGVRCLGDPEFRQRYLFSRRFHREGAQVSLFSVFTFLFWWSGMAFTMAVALMGYDAEAVLVYLGPMLAIDLLLIMIAVAYENRRIRRY